MMIKGFDIDYFKQALFDYVSKNYSDWATGMTVDDVVRVVKEQLYPEAENNKVALEKFYSDYGASWGLSPNKFLMLLNIASHGQRNSLS